MGNIAISNVTKKFDSTEVIHGINLKINDSSSLKALLIL